MDRVDRIFDNSVVELDRIFDNSAGFVDTELVVLRLNGREITAPF